jgi:hypothetical protein
MSFVIALMLGAAPARLPPIEQCGGDAAFDRFRRQLETAVARRDLHRINALMAPDIHLSFGSAVWAPKFRLHERSQPGGGGLWQNSLWDELAKVLRLGCGTARSGGVIQYRAWPAMFVTGAQLDGYETWVSLPGATQRRQPDPNAPILQRLPAWTVLHELQEAVSPYMKVSTPKGRTGFVERDQLRSLIDYRLIAERRRGRWLITAFVAGD